jgi:NAD(P)-dependent dehydrogenase (short-subunit alcohol dehydrogenase family)
MSDSPLESNAETGGATVATDADAPPVALVTGGTGVTGSAVVRRLADRGERVMAVGRDVERGEALASSATTEADGEVRFLEADLASQAATRSLAETVRSVGRLDRLVAAVGSFERERETTVDGVERTLAVNYLSTYLLVHDLLPLLVETGPDALGGAMGAGPNPARIVTLTASVADQPIEFDDLQSSEGYTLQDAHATSKRCLTAFTLELAERLPEGVAADTLHPGFVPGGRSRSELPWYVRGSMSVLSKLSVGDGAEAAADRAVRLATDESGATGRYVEGDDSVETPGFAADPDVRAKLWERSAELVDVDPDWV